MCGVRCIFHQPREETVVPVPPVSIVYCFFQLLLFNLQKKQYHHPRRRNSMYHRSVSCPVSCIVCQPLEETVCTTVVYRALFLALSVNPYPQTNLHSPPFGKPTHGIVLSSSFRGKGFRRCQYSYWKFKYNLESQRMTLFYLPHQHHHHSKEKVWGFQYFLASVFSKSPAQLIRLKNQQQSSTEFNSILRKWIFHLCAMMLLELIC